MTIKTTRAFTLIELMVVISIISMLASVVLASLKPIRAQAQDAKRKEEIHSVDLAIQAYISDKGYPPDLGSCAAQVSVPTSLPSGCIAVSTQGLDGFPANQTPTTPWGKLAKQLSPYIPVIPSDSCTSGCLAPDGTPLGYTYVAPAAVQYYSSGSNTSYQLSAALETGSSISGISGQNSIVITAFTSTPASISRGASVTLSWNATNASYCWGAGTGPSGRMPTTYSVVQSPWVSTTYSLVCVNSTSGASSATSTVMVNVSAF